MAYINGKKILFSPQVNITKEGGGVDPTLIEKSITANGTYTASTDNADGYSSVTVNVPSSGGGSEIIEVDELPEVGEDGTVYKIPIDTFDSLLINGNGYIYADFCSIVGIESKCNYRVKTKPTEDIMTSTGTKVYLYYVEDENDIFLCQLNEDSGDYEWLTFAEFMDVTDGSLTFKGAITDESEANEEGYYAFGIGEDYKYYQYDGNDQFIDIIADGCKFSEYALNGIQVGFYESETKPTENIKVSGFSNTYSMYCYYITSENDIFLCQLNEDSGDYEWLTFAEFMDVTDGSLTFKGAITDESEATDGDAYYALCNLPHYNKLIFEKDVPVTTSEERTVTPTKSTQTITPSYDVDYLSKVIVNPIPDKYIIPSGTINLNENGTYDVAQYSKAITNVTTVYTVQTKAKLPTDAKIGSFAFVLGGE